MMSTVSSPVDMDSVESALRHGLASGDATAESIVPILRHVLTSEDSSLFGDEIIARVRGMLADIAAQLLDRQDDEDTIPADQGAARVGILGDVLLESAALLGHLHALALEWQLIQRVEARFGIDPVLTPMLQALIASNSSETASLAMHLLAAQARHCQMQRRMSLPLLELPAELLHVALTALRSASNRLGEAGEQVDIVQARVRRNYNEASTRLGLASRLVSSLGTDASDALSIRHAGATIFLTTLAIGAGMERDQAAISTHESQSARFALALRASGLNGRAVLEQCFALHPDFSFPEGLEGLSADRAAAILASGGAHFGA